MKKILNPWLHIPEYSCPGCCPTNKKGLRLVFWHHTTKQKQVMYEGRLLKSELVEQGGEKFYVEKVGFKDWHVSLHNFYLISDRLCDGHTIVEQSWNYDDFCNITIRLEDCTFALIRQVDCISLVRSDKSMPVDEFDRMARPLII